MGVTAMHTVTLTVSDQLLRDTLTIAIEGGVNYWAKGRRFERLPNLEYVSCEIAELADEGSEPVKPGYHRVGPEALTRGFQLALTPGIQLNSAIRAAIASAVAEDDGGQIDASAADVIVQLAIFGDIVYG